MQKKIQLKNKEERQNGAGRVNWTALQKEEEQK